MWRRAFLFGLGLPAASGALEVEKALKKGLTGYELFEATDPWFGSDNPDARDPWAFLEEQTGNGDGRLDILDWQKAGLPDSHFHYFDKDKDGLLSEPEVYAWYMQRKPAQSMDLSDVEKPPRGHLQRLGSWKEPLPSAHLEYSKPYPHPRDFWHKHMDGYLPANLKGAQHGWPCMNWTREELIRRFGWVEAKVEPKTESRESEHATGAAYQDVKGLTGGKARLNVSDYLQQEEGKNIYVVSIIPQVMAWEVAHPSVLQCGSRRKVLNTESDPPYKLKEHHYPHEAGHDWMTHLFEANLWMASGRTRSQLHYDKEWNVNCLLSGRKKWFFLDPFNYTDDLHWARGDKFDKKNPLNNRGTDWVWLDPDSVDLIVQHKLRNMEYYELIQEPGDCIFIPYAMLHQVEKLDEGLQVAVSWMFLPETVYDEQACVEAPLFEDLPLAAMDVLYQYSGRGIIPQGYQDPKLFLKTLKEELTDRQEEIMSYETFAEVVMRGASILATVKDEQRVRDLYDLMVSYAPNPDEGLFFDQIDEVPMRVWCKAAAEGDEAGALDCDDGQEYHICDDEEVDKMNAYVEEVMTKDREEQYPKRRKKLKPGENKWNQRVYFEKPKRKRPRRSEL